MEYIHIRGLKKSHSFLCPGFLHGRDSWPQSRGESVTFCCVSQNHRTVRVGRDLWSSASKPPKAVCYSSGTGMCPIGFEYLQRRRPPHLSMQLCQDSVPSRERSSSLYWCGTSHVAVGAHCPLSCHWTLDPNPIHLSPTLQIPWAASGMFSVVDNFILIYQPEPLRMSPQWRGHPYCAEFAIIAWGLRVPHPFWELAQAVLTCYAAGTVSIHHRQQPMVTACRQALGRLALVPFHSLGDTS